jgi:hypothetical protein
MCGLIVIFQPDHFAGGGAVDDVFTRLDNLKILFVDGNLGHYNLVDTMAVTELWVECDVVFCYEFCLF